MDSGPALAAEQRDRSVRSRRHYRHTITSLAYVRLDHGNGGIIRNVSESGIAIQAVGRLHKDQLVHLRFELLRPKIRVDITGQVTWADSAGQAGLRFIDPVPKLQRQLRDWIFGELLAIATEFGPVRSPIFGIAGEQADDFGLLGRANPVSADVEEDVILNSQPEMPVRLPWWPVDIRPGTLAKFVDILVVLSAVLLFGVIGIEMVGEFPGPGTALLMALGLCGVLTGVYYGLFKFVMGMTAGAYLAKVAAQDMQWLQDPSEKVTRFR